MPCSSNLGKKAIHDWFCRQEDIKRIVDIGCGAGTYSDMLRARGYYMIGVEILEAYIEKYNLLKKYDDIYIGDFTRLTLPPADCAIYGDVLEHIEKDRARRQILLADSLYRHVVISMPIDYPQAGLPDNPYEEHKGVWSFEEMCAAIPPSFTFRARFGYMGVFIK